MKHSFQYSLLGAASAVLCVFTAHAQVGKQGNLIDANHATKQQWLAMPHITEEIAAEIEVQPTFGSITDLNKLLAKHLTKEQLTALYQKTFVHINLNAATREELLLIPGVGNRMAHEFEEYRPYKSLAQFRREIGKYVDDEEVARLERYVFIPIPLNSASDEDIQSIPGIGPRMLHEFKEYRPYRNIEQFRREIGKYVDKDEVARFERYVSLE